MINIRIRRNLRNTFAAVIVFLSGSAATSAETPSAAFGMPPDGAIVKYESGLECRVKRISEMETHCVQPGQSPIPIKFFAGIEIYGNKDSDGYSQNRWNVRCGGSTRPGGLILRLGLDSDEKGKLARIWPLEVGKTVEYELTYNELNSRINNPQKFNSGSVAEVEVIGKKTTPFMGKQVEVYVIKKSHWNGPCPDSNLSDHTETIWYSPEYKFVIMREIVHEKGPLDGETATMEVMSIVTPGQSTAAQQIAAQPKPAVRPAKPVAQISVAVAADTTAPVISLPPEINTSRALVIIKGRISDQSNIVEVLVDGRPVSMTADGVISVRRAVPVGKTDVTIIAMDEWGNEASSVVHISRANRVAAAVPKAITAPAPAPQPVTPVVVADTIAPEIIVAGIIKTSKGNAVITGQVKDASGISALTLNGEKIAFKPDGTFSVIRSVPMGKSTMQLAVLDIPGNASKQTLSIERSSLFKSVNFGTYHALIIGNNNYDNLNNLETAEGDARAIADILSKEYKYQTQVINNATRSDIIGALAGYRAKLKANDNLLIYYAGHGILDEYAEEGYWLPVDAAKDNPSNWVSNGDLTNMIRAMRAKHVMVIADSCYSGTLVRAAEAKVKTAKARETWVKRMSGKRTRTALVSGGLEPVLDGGGDGHSVFAKAFMDALKGNDDVLEAQAMYAAIKRPVALESDQTPQYSDIRRAGHDGGDFLFVRR
jgi:uncharacterized caspase-like protein